jgi:ribosomal protein L14
MKRSNTIKFSTAIIAIMFLFPSCQWGSKREEPRGKNIICVVDFSDSKNATERLQFYMNAIKDNIIPKLGLHDKITVIPIDKASITNASDILLTDLSVKNFEPEQASPMEVQITIENLKRYKDTLAIEFAQKFQIVVNNRNKSNHGTDIFGALEVVKRKLKLRDDNYLIILSDMMNWSSTLNMESDNKEFNIRTLDNILGKVPNYEMENVTVLVLTAEQLEVSPEHFKLVQSFWSKYFEKNQIKLFDYNSASVAKLNELMILPVVE